MSKSLKRVRTALEMAGIDAKVIEMSEGTRTAADAARACACQIDQIAKSIIFRGETSGHVILYLTAGGNQVDADKASALAGEPPGQGGRQIDPRRDRVCHRGRVPGRDDQPGPRLLRRASSGV